MDSPRYIEPQYLKQVLICLTGRNRDIFIFLLLTGLRVNELCRLECRDIAGGVVTIREEISKTGQKRVIPFGDLIRELLPQYLIGKSREKRLFPISIRRVQQIFQKVSSLVGIRITPHMLRHTFATRLITCGVSTAVVQNLLGHKHLSSTQVYTGITQESKSRAIVKLTQSIHKDFSSLSPNGDNNTEN